ncbi:hypothetical protein A2U01_0018229 [Trifolium medium]|uniref:Uncharacterized protein n=1 Tax=Trifolium medium TaxID=97028 RepID=A0A392NBL1_9FABA|nr:hypothetical protein [Trifolium medium]
MSKKASEERELLKRDNIANTLNKAFKKNQYSHHLKNVSEDQPSKEMMSKQNRDSEEDRADPSFCFYCIKCAKHVHCQRCRSWISKKASTDILCTSKDYFKGIELIN